MKNIAIIKMFFPFNGARKSFLFFGRKTEVEWSNFSELEGTIANSIRWISLDSTTQCMDWDQSYDQL